MTSQLTPEEATRMLDELYAQGSSISVQEMNGQEAAQFGADKHLQRGYFVVLTSKRYEIFASPVFKNEVFADQHGVYKIHVSKEEDLTDTVIADSIADLLRKVRDKEEARVVNKKIGEYSLKQAKKAVRKR